MFRLSLIVTAACLAVPVVAAADVPITVPADLLGGRVAPAQTTAIDPTDPDDEDGVDLSDPEFWDEVWPIRAAALAPPEEIEVDCDEDLVPGSCGLWGDEAAALEPESVTETSAVAAPPESTIAVSRRLRPTLGAWMTSQTPTLQWTPEPGATRYNVQIYLGPRRVASVWTTGTRVRIPRKVIDQGRYYMWGVFPGFGSATKPTFRKPLGRSVFGVVLRPRIRFTRVAGGVVGEVRPHIPSGTLRLTRPQSLASRVPRKVVVNQNSRIRLTVTTREAERIGARLLTPGPTPPRGIRRPNMP